MGGAHPTQAPPPAGANGTDCSSGRGTGGTEGMEGKGSESQKIKRMNGMMKTHCPVQSNVCPSQTLACMW